MPLTQYIPSNCFYSKIFFCKKESHLKLGFFTASHFIFNIYRGRIWVDSHIFLTTVNSLFTCSKKTCSGDF